MTYTPMSTPRGFVTFCDDVRREDNFKFFYIGVYSSGIVINSELPATLTKLCFVVSYIERRGESDEQVRIVVRCPWDEPGTPTAIVDFPEDFRASAPPAVEGLEDPQSLMNITFNVAPFVVKSAGAITVMVERGAEEYRIGRMPIFAEPHPKEDKSPAPPRKRRSRGPAGRARQLKRASS